MEITVYVDCFWFITLNWIMQMTDYWRRFRNWIPHPDFKLIFEWFEVWLVKDPKEIHEHLPLPQYLYQLNAINQLNSYCHDIYNPTGGSD